MKQTKAINGKWYPAYAWRHQASPRDTLLDKPCDTYEEALEIARGELCDDDSCDVFFYNVNRWWRLVYDYKIEMFTFKKANDD